MLQAVLIDLGVCGFGAGGALIYLLLLRPVRHQAQLSKMVMTLGLPAVLAALLIRAFDTSTAVTAVVLTVALELSSMRGYVIGRGELIAHRTAQMWRNSLGDLSELSVI
jgi:branched-subunit amino acid ABC-type transport system permease component